LLKLGTITNARLPRVIITLWPSCYVTREGLFARKLIRESPLSVNIPLIGI
jgi:hypothetical protein